MCYHFKQTKDSKRVEKRFKAVISEPESFSPSQHYNGFDYPQTPVILNHSPEWIEMGSWGLQPEWANGDWNKNYGLNARIETLNERPAFKDAYHNRCLIIVDGFFEWKHIGKQRIKYDIGFNDELFALGGIYTEIDGAYSYAIVTTEAQGVMREIHHHKLRMPFALQTEEEFDLWLNAEEFTPRFDYSALALDDIQTSLF